MAQGDVTVFSKAKERVGDAELDLGGGSFMAALTTGVTAPTENATDPRWSASGNPDFSAEEVTPGGNYSAGGASLSTVITDNWSLSGNTCTFDGDNVSWAQDGANPTDARWLLCYLNDANKYNLFYTDLGQAFDMSNGDLSVTWSGAGIFTLA